MNWVKRVIKSVLIGFVVSAIIYGASQTLFYYPFIHIQNSIENSYFKLRYSIKDPDSYNTDQIVIIDINDQTLKELGNFNRFWPRRYFAKVIGNLKSDNARLIFLDVFITESGNFLENKALADSIKSAGNVFSGFYLNLDSRGKGQHSANSVFNGHISNWFDSRINEEVDFLQSESIALSYRDIIRSSRNIGFTNYVPDADGVLRHFPLFIEFKQWLIPSAFLQIWLYLKGFDYTNAEIFPEGVHYGENFIPTDNRCFMRINYKGSGSVYNYISFANVLKGNFETGTFKNKIVMIGSSSPKLNDIKRIPGNEFIPGVEVHAAALSTILNQDYLKVASEKAIYIIAMLFGIISSIFFSFTHPIKTGLPFAVSVPLLLYIASIYSFISNSLMINITIPTCVIIVLYIYTIYPLLVRNK